LVIKIHSMYN